MFYNYTKRTISIASEVKVYISGFNTECGYFYKKYAIK